MILLFVCSYSNAQESNILYLDSNSERLYLMPFVQELSDSSTLNDSLGIILQDKILEGEFPGAYQKLFKISLLAQDSINDFRFVSKLGNYATDLHLFYFNSEGKLIEETYKYNSRNTFENDAWIREAVFPLNASKGSIDLYILGDYNSWPINEWYLYSKEGYGKHQKIFSRHAIVYLVLVSIFLLFAIVGYILLRSQIIAYYTFYLFATSLYIFKEINTLPLQFLYDNPILLNLLNESIVSIFILALIFYIKSICPHESSFSKILFKVLVVSTVVSMLTMSFMVETSFGFALSMFVNYGANLYFILQVVSNFKKSIPIRFFLSGILIIVVLGVLMELQLYGVIYFPEVFYWTIPGLILELLLIGIGVIYGLKQRSTELNQMKLSNSKLNASLTNLEKKVSLSKGAYQTMMARSSNGTINLPPEYLNYPLTQREIEVVHLLDKGYNNQELAREMFISRNTVKTHLKNIYKKLDVSNREAALEKMRSYGLI